MSAITVSTAGGGLRSKCHPGRQATSLARGASDECDMAVALPLSAVSSQNVIGSFEARFFAPREKCWASVDGDKDR